MGNYLVYIPYGETIQVLLIALAMMGHSIDNNLNMILSLGWVYDNEINQFPVLSHSTAVKHLISQMLDPCATTRITVQEILSHPWMINTTTPLQRKRRNGVCHFSPETIRQSLLEINDCNCPCHKIDSARRCRDSVITKHCEDCEDFIANDPAVMHRRQVRLSRNSSICSSGYGSEFGSQYLNPVTPRASQNGVRGFLDVSSGIHRSSIPRKSSATMHHRCSVPTSTNILKQSVCSKPILTNDEDDIVFV